MADSRPTASAADHRWPEGERGAFSDDALVSWTLPSRYYTDAGIHQRELTAIFRRAWSYVGHETDLGAPGSYFTDEVADQPIVLIRGRDGEIRAFFNVCQHRGHLLLRGRGALSASVVCPYHAWSYDFDGRLKNAPMTDGVAGFEKNMFCLRSLPVTAVGGLLFVSLDRSSRPLRDEAPGFEETIADSLPELSEFVAVERMELEIAANWKVVVDNFSEGYHIPVAHPALAKLHGRKTTTASVGEKFGFFRGVGRTSFDEFAVKPDEPYLTWWLWPSLCMLSLPGSKNLIVLRLMPDGPSRCRERADIYAPADETSPNLSVVKRLFAEKFNREDIAIVESVQRGLSSLGYDQGRYVVDKADAWYSESGLHRFHRQILKALADAGD